MEFNKREHGDTFDATEFLYGKKKKVYYCQSCGQRRLFPPEKHEYIGGTKLSFCSEKCFEKFKNKYKGGN